MPRLRAGIDVGGTFTDLVIVDDAGHTYTHKTLTTPDDPARGAAEGLAEALSRHGLAAADLDLVVHGTTRVSNALIERKGGPVALLTTRGARDVLEQGREHRYDPHDRRMTRPAPLVPRPLRRTVAGRLHADGSEREPLDAAEIEAALRELAAREPNLQAVAVAFLHSFTNPEHEQRAGEIVRRVLPGVHVSLSAEVAPRIREWERTSTAVANAFVQPVMADYLGRLGGRLADLGYRRDLFLMLSDGGLASVGTARAFPIRLVESGPAAGALAAAAWARTLGPEGRRVLSLDMGGTTAKICVIDDCRPTRASEFEVARVHRFKKGSGLPVAVPSIELIEIGAGGGSIAGIDPLGLLKVGPESAGADPGPACYGLGGTEPTVSDADLVLGYLNPERILGGEMAVDAAAARAALGRLGDRLGLDPEGAAAAVRRVVTEAMAAAARVHAAERGKDPADYTLIAFGGAGPIHACDVARALKVRHVVVPPGAGVASALGFLAAPVAIEVGRTHFAMLAAAPATADASGVGASSEPSGALPELEAVFRELEAAGAAALTDAGVPWAEHRFERGLDLRYRGQGHEVAVTLPEPAAGVSLAEAIAERFEATYRQLFGHALDRAEIEITAARVWAAGPTPRVAALEASPPGVSAETDAAASGERDGRPEPRGARVASRRAYFDGGFVEATVFDRGALRPGDRLVGPAIIEEPSATTVVPPAAEVTVDARLCLRVDLAASAAAEPGRGRSERGRALADDPVGFEIMLARLNSVADEADAALMRTAFSTVAREGRDFSLIVADTHGNCVAMPSASMPLFVTALPRTLSLILEQRPLATWQPGDVWITNDPWLCAGHKSDITIAGAVYGAPEAGSAPRPVGLVGVILHAADIGGVIGDHRALDIYEEGLAIPLMKLREAGRLNELLLELIAANVRTPDLLRGDLAAMEAALNVAARKLVEVLRESGLESIDGMARELHRRADAAMRAEIAAIPDGVYRYTHIADGFEGAPGFPISVAVEVRGDRARIDFTGTAPQVKAGSISVPLSYTLADTIYAFKYMLTPHLPTVGARFEPLEIVAPPGCILNALPPASVYARTRTGLHIATAIFAALAVAIPEKVQAGCGHNIIIRAHALRDDGTWAMGHIMPKGGMGAQHDRDGLDCTIFPTNDTTTPIEVMERTVPLLLEKEMLPGSGGAGRYRGGLGQRLSMRNVGDREVTITLRTNFQNVPPPGLLGGRPGSNARISFNGVPTTRSVFHTRPGDVVAVETAGGGGFGDPAERAPELIARDRELGLIE